MALNLIELVSQRFDDSALHQLSRTLGEDPAHTKTALDGAVPTVLSGLINLTATREGTGKLLSSLQSFKQEEQVLANLGDFLNGSDGHQSMLRAGQRLLNSLFGDRLDGLVDSLSRLSGMSRQSAGALISTVAPIVTSVLGKQQDDLALDEAGLSKLLNDQKDFVKQSMPAGLSDAIDLDGLLSGAGDLGGKIQQTVNETLDKGIDSVQGTIDKTTSAIENTVEDTIPEPVAKSGGSSFFKLIVWLIILFAIAWFAVRFLATV
jgi:hypothetical protein